MSKISTTTRRELVATIRDRYQAAARLDKQRILDEFVALTGYHRKHAVRVLGSAMDEGQPSSVLATDVVGQDRHGSRGPTVVDVKPTEHARDLASASRNAASPLNGLGCWLTGAGPRGSYNG